jgi:hypothetical protein
MLNLNYNIIGAGGFDRYSKEEAKGFIPFQVQYLIVAGGGGSAGGDNNLQAGQAGGGGQVVTGSYCVYPFNTYAVKVGGGGNGGQRTATFPAYTGSNGETSSFAEYIALGGNGGYIQNEVTLSFFAGSGSGAAPFEGNGGAGSQWTYNLATSSYPPFPPFNHAGELISSSFYGGGGAGFQVGPPTIEYLVVGGGGGGAGFASSPLVGQGGGNGGEVRSGSFVAYPNEEYTVDIGAGGPGGQTNPAVAQPTGSCGTGSFISGSNTVLPFFASANGGVGGVVNFGLGDNGTGSLNKNGLQWVDGKWYGGGGAPCTFDATYGGLGGGGNGCFPFNLTSFDRYGNSIFPFQIPNTNTGGGAGGGAGQGTSRTASGSAGIVAFRYASEPIATGGEIVISGSYTYHYFTASGELNITLDPLLIYPGLPGVGGGGATASNATPNTGGGAGASFYFDSGSNGGSGFVALRYEGAPIAEGGDIVVTDHYTYHIYSASGEFYAIGNETNQNINPCDSQTLAEYIVIAGGGGGASTTLNGGNAAGGGAGGYITGSFILENSVATNVIVGAGGLRTSRIVDGKFVGSGSNGQNSNIVNLFGANAIGGGAGGYTGATLPEGDAAGATGGSGGGDAGAGGGAGIPPQGNSGNGIGGGGALNPSTSSIGGLGITWLDGNTYSNGGNGNALVPFTGSLIAGNGGQGAIWQGTGEPNISGNGVSGSVIIRYVGTPKASGGVVTQTGGYTYHTFTSSGLFDPIP